MISYFEFEMITETTLTNRAQQLLEKFYHLTLLNANKNYAEMPEQINTNTRRVTVTEAAQLVKSKGYKESKLFKNVLHGSFIKERKRH